MDSKYDAIIIGAGLGGLTCGNLLAKHGFKVLIAEQHFVPGGYCTSYKKNNFVFDVPVIMTDMREGDLSRQLFSYLDICDKIDFIEIEILSKIIGPDINLNWYSDTYKLEQEFISKFPEETKSIQRYFKEIRKLWKEMQNTHYKPSLLQMITYPFRFPKTVKYNNYTFDQFVCKFIKNEKLRDLLGKEAITLGLSRHKISALYYIAMIMSYATGGIWYPKGGFQQIADRFAESFQNYGGVLKLKTEVKRILLENRQAVGVELVSGEKQYAKYIISNADTKKTFLNLLQPENAAKTLKRKINRLEQSLSGFVVKLAVKMELSELKNCAWLFYFPEYGSTCQMLNLAASDDLDIENCSFSIETAPLSDPSEEGISIINLVVLPVSYNYKNKWLSEDKNKYNDLKNKVARQLIEKAEKFIPGLSGNILAMDIATPITFERYTSSTNGGWYDIAVTSKQSLNHRMGPDTKIRGLYLTGAKTIPGPGINTAISSGLFTADMILKGQLTGGKCYLKADLLGKNRV